LTAGQIRPHHRYPSQDTGRVPRAEAVITASYRPRPVDTKIFPRPFSQVHR